MNKFRSAKLWVTIWAMFMATFIVVADRSNYAGALPMLAGVPIAYIGMNVWQKKIYSDRDARGDGGDGGAPLMVG